MNTDPVMEDSNKMLPLTLIKRTILIVLGLLLLSMDTQAQPVRDKILADADIRQESECAFVRVGFNFPVRYVKHFPYEYGEELRIQLDPIAISPVDRDALFKRESMRPPSNEIAALLEIIYEGDMEGGPFLTLLFRRPVAFKVGQGADFRSLMIVVPGSKASAPCHLKP